MALVKIPLDERFWSKVLKTDTCWIWQAQLNNKGYGVFMYYSKKLRRKSRQMYAHRVSWTLTYGAIPDAMRVLHKCDNPPCCNPEHLFLGTQADNMNDMASKGRSGKGGQNAKVTPDQVRAIRSDPRKHHIIAAEYGLKRMAILKIKHRQSWVEVD